jgi:hypothetical protein
MISLSMALHNRERALSSSSRLSMLNPHSICHRWPYMGIGQWSAMNLR